MEKSEKRRFSMKPKLEPVEKAKNTRRNSKMIKTKTQENEIQQQQNQPAPPNTMIQNTVPIMQAQYYGMQPQMLPYGQPMMMGALPGQDISQNQYVLNQINPGPPVAFVPLKFGYSTQEIVCPYCQVHGSTKIVENFNCCTLCLYFFIILLVPLLLVLAAMAGCNSTKCNCSGSNCDCDCNCRCCVYGCDCKCCIDTKHYCTNCGKLIGTRDSCIELCPCFSCCCGDGFFC